MPRVNQIQKNGFQKTKAISKLRRMRRRIRVVPGGTSAGKTFGILPILIDRAIKSTKDDPYNTIEISVVWE